MFWRQIFSMKGPYFHKWVFPLVDSLLVQRILQLININNYSNIFRFVLPLDLVQSLCPGTPCRAQGCCPGRSSSSSPSAPLQWLSCRFCPPDGWHITYYLYIYILIIFICLATVCFSQKLYEFNFDWFGYILNSKF